MSGDQWTTCVGSFADQVGAIRWQNDEVHRAIGPGGRELVSVTRHVELAHEPASKYAASQPSEIPILWRHKGAPIGRCVLLDRRSGRLLAVAVLKGPAEFFTDNMPPLYWSSGTVDDGQLRIRELSLTPSPATSALPPARFFPGLPNEARGLHGAPWGMVNRADEILRAAHGVEYARCQFDDLDRPKHDARGGKSRDMGDGMIYIETAPIGRVLKVNGRPVGRQ